MIKSIKQLKQLPTRKWDEKKSYKSLLVIPSGKKHDSGWSLMYIIGVDGDDMEIASACDDILWDVSAIEDEYSFRTDMYYKPHIIHFWSNGFIFNVGVSLSSTTVTLVKKL